MGKALASRSGSSSARNDERLDQLLVSRAIAESREKAKGLILSGAVLVDGRKADKAGIRVSKTAEITLVPSALPYHGLRYVGRGGLKMEAALEAFGLDPSGRVIVDLGASTGGFTDCLLQRRARRVYAVDVGYGQLAWRLRQDPRVVVLERTHVRDLTRDQVPEPADWITIDLSFISLTRILSIAVEFLKPGGLLLALVKPQFEVGRGGVGKGGIVRDASKRLGAVEKVRRAAGELGLVSGEPFECPVHGQDGNVEYFLLLKYGAS